jgi:hypothetical protein
MVGASHVLHVPAHALLQQTPSAQKPDAHCRTSAGHGWPFASPGTHWLEPLQ